MTQDAIFADFDTVDMDLQDGTTITLPALNNFPCHAGNKIMAYLGNADYWDGTYTKLVNEDGTLTLTGGGYIDDTVSPPVITGTTSGTYTLPSTVIDPATGATVNVYPPGIAPYALNYNGIYIEVPYSLNIEDEGFAWLEEAHTIDPIQDAHTGEYPIISGGAHQSFHGGHIATSAIGRDHNHPHQQTKHNWHGIIYRTNNSTLGNGSNTGTTYVYWSGGTLTTHDGTTLSVATSGTPSGPTDTTGLLATAEGWIVFNPTPNDITVTTVQANGPVASVTINNGGTGYTSVPSVQFSAPDQSGGTTAQGTATVSGGAVTGIAISNAGSGYNSPPTITFGGPGSGAIATANLNSRTNIAKAYKSTYDATNHGGYSCVDTLINNTTTYTVDFGEDPYVPLIIVGKLSQTIDSVSHNFWFQAWHQGAFEVHSVHLAKGVLSTSQPNVPAYFLIQDVYMAVETTGTSNVVVDWIDSAPSAPIPEILAGDNSHNYQIYPIANSKVTGVSGVALTNVGSNYNTPPTVTFSAPTTGTRATGTALLSNGRVVGVDITNAGSGYTTAPSVSFNNTGTGGSGAAATAILSSLQNMTVNSGDIIAYNSNANFPTSGVSRNLAGQTIGPLRQDHDPTGNAINPIQYTGGTLDPGIWLIGRISSTVDSNTNRLWIESWYGNLHEAAGFSSGDLADVHKSPAKFHLQEVTMRIAPGQETQFSGVVKNVPVSWSSGGTVIKNTDPNHPLPITNTNIFINQDDYIIYNSSSIPIYLNGLNGTQIAAHTIASVDSSVKFDPAFFIIGTVSHNVDSKSNLLKINGWHVGLHQTHGDNLAWSSVGRYNINSHNVGRFQLHGVTMEVGSWDTTLPPLVAYRNQLTARLGWLPGRGEAFGGRIGGIGYGSAQNPSVTLTGGNPSGSTPPTTSAVTDYNWDGNNSTLTSGSVTNITISSPGNFLYSTPPEVQISDPSHIGHGASAISVIDSTGKLTGFRLCAGTVNVDDGTILPISPIGIDDPTLAPTYSIHSSSGGTRATGTYNYVYNWFDANFNQTLLSPPISVPVTLGQTITITAPFRPSSAYGMNLYIQSGSNYYQIVHSTNISSLTDTGQALGAAAPSGNNTYSNSPAQYFSNNNFVINHGNWIVYDSDIQGIKVADPPGPGGPNQSSAYFPDNYYVIGKVSNQVDANSRLLTIQGFQEGLHQLGGANIQDGSLSNYHLNDHHAHKFVVHNVKLKNTTGVAGTSPNTWTVSQWDSSDSTPVPYLAMTTGANVSTVAYQVTAASNNSFTGFTFQASANQWIAYNSDHLNTVNGVLPRQIGPMTTAPANNSYVDSRLFLLGRVSPGYDPTSGLLHINGFHVGLHQVNGSLIDPGAIGLTQAKIGTFVGNGWNKLSSKQIAPPSSVSRYSISSVSKYDATNSPANGVSISSSSPNQVDASGLSDFQVGLEVVSTYTGYPTSSSNSPSVTSLAQAKINTVQSGTSVLNDLTVAGSPIFDTNGLVSVGIIGVNLKQGSSGPIFEVLWQGCVPYNGGDVTPFTIIPYIQFKGLAYIVGA